jgi:hypothetical protein
LTIDIALLKQNFPHLIRFSDRLMRDLCVFRGIAPVEINIPKEFLFGDIPRSKPCCIGGVPKISAVLSTSTDGLGTISGKVCSEDMGNLLFMCPRCTSVHNARQRPPLGIDYPMQLELVQEAARAFNQIGYSYYDHYLNSTSMILKNYFCY